jgi:selenocysteine lyase/cysteine desulfurase
VPAGAAEAGVRVGLAPYNDDAEIDRLLTGLADFLAPSTGG